MLMGGLPTCADQVPAQPVPEVMEHTVSVLLGGASKPGQSEVWGHHAKDNTNLKSTCLDCKGISSTPLLMCPVRTPPHNLSLVS